MQQNLLRQLFEESSRKDVKHNLGKENHAYFAVLEKKDKALCEEIKQELERKALIIGGSGFAHALPKRKASSLAGVERNRLLNICEDSNSNESDAKSGCGLRQKGSSTKVHHSRSRSLDDSYLSSLASNAQASATTTTTNAPKFIESLKSSEQGNNFPRLCPSKVVPTLEGWHSGVPTVERRRRRCEFMPKGGGGGNAFCLMAHHAHLIFISLPGLSRSQMCERHCVGARKTALVINLRIGLICPERERNADRRYSGCSIHSRSLPPPLAPHHLVHTLCVSPSQSVDNNI